MGAWCCVVQEAKAEKQFEELLEKVEPVPAEEVEALCRQLQDLVSQLRPDGSVLAAAGQFVLQLSRCSGLGRLPAVLVR